MVCSLLGASAAMDSPTEARAAATRADAVYRIPSRRDKNRSTGPETITTAMAGSTPPRSRTARIAFFRQIFAVSAVIIKIDFRTVSVVETDENASAISRAARKNRVADLKIFYGVKVVTIV